MFNELLAAKSVKVLGMMSGTSGDGIDGALVEFWPDGSSRLLWQDSMDYSEAQFQRIQKLMRGANVVDVTLGASYVAELHAMACQKFFAGKAILPDIIAPHGQTVWHQPVAVTWDSIALTGTLQLMNGALLAQRTHIPVVCNFRAADMAVGGQGAPLVPFADLYLFGKNASCDRLIVNVGGMANLTAISLKNGGPEVACAFDTGPGNVLMDAFMQTIGRDRFDCDGRLASTGKTMQTILKNFLTDPYFSAPPPKSTGREYFNQHRLDEIIAAAGNSPAPADLMSTLLDITVNSMADAISGLEGLIKFPAEVLVAGGGARNSELMRRLSVRLQNTCNVTTTENYGVPVMARESMAFAILGYAFISNNPANVPCATGASRPVTLGEYHPA